MKKKICISIVILCTFLIPATRAQENQELLTLQQAIETGLQNNFDILISRGNNNIAENNVSPGAAGMLPQLFLQGGVAGTKEDVDQEFRSGEANQRQGATSNNYNAEVVLQWNLFDGTGMFIRYDRSKAFLNKTREETREVIRNTLSDIVKKYYRVVMEQEQLDVLDSALMFSEERLQIVKKQWDVGHRSKQDYLAAKVDYNEDRSAFLVQKEILQTEKVALNTLLSRNPSAGFTVQEEINVQEELVLGDLIAGMENNNPQLQAKKIGLQVSKLTTKELQSNRAPTLDFNLSYGYNRLVSQAGFLLSNASLGFTYTLTARWYLFNGFELNRQIDNARIAYEQSELLYEQTRLNLLSHLQQFYLIYQNRLEMVELEQENVKVARENEDIAISRFRIGRSSSLELREAQQNRIQAEIRLLEARFRAKAAEVELMRISKGYVKNE